MMDTQGDEEPAGPSVDSEDPEERILARRLRIQKRQEAQKKYILHLHFVFGLFIYPVNVLQMTAPTSVYKIS